MASLEAEVIDALDTMNSGKDFFIQGGAGSGKTYSMICLLGELYRQEPSAEVACITYTNVAVNEIRSRFPFPSLHVSTIHEFLWSLIKHYQKDVRVTLAEQINGQTITSSFSLPIKDTIWDGQIQHKEWSNYEAGEISHDDVLRISLHMFQRYEKLARIFADLHDYVFVDEYQDTPPEVLNILFNVLPDSENRSMRIGLFGDSEQAIYEEDKGKEFIDEVVKAGHLKPIIKVNNRRNPASVIRVINHLRADQLRQEQSTDPNAPNFGVEGSAKFIYTETSDLSVNALKALELCKGWEFSSNKTKLLYLTKAMIAKEGKFSTLMSIYNKDHVVEHAKKIRKESVKKGLDLSDVSPGTLGAVLAEYAKQIPPTATQREAFEDNSGLLDFAKDFLFEDVSTTSTDSDRLLGTKKVSEFDDRDRGSKRDPLINHLLSIELLRGLYRQGRFSEIIRKFDLNVESIKARVAVAKSLEELNEFHSCSVGDVLAFVDKTGLLKRGEKLRYFEGKHPYRFARVMEVNFEEVSNLYSYVEDHLSFSTQHGVKGGEWDNVFVSLDNGNWNSYNFVKLLLNPDSEDSVPSRSRMMLYVACSRPRKNLIVHVHQPPDRVLDRAKDWFGDQNVICVDALL